MKQFVTRVAHSNPNKAIIDKALISMLSYEQGLLDKTLSNIVRENQNLGGTMNGFRFDGFLYCITNVSDMRFQNVKQLHQSLIQEFQTYLVRTQQLKKNINYIRNALSTVLSKCKHLQDCRDVLPDLLVNQIDELKTLPRIREEGFVLKNNPLLFKQFTEAMDLVAHYHANKLLY